MEESRRNRIHPYRLPRQAEATQDIIARSVHGNLSEAEEQRVIADAG